MNDPFASASKGLGRDLFFTEENYNLIMTKGVYKNLAGKERPVPQYYKNLFLSGASQSQIEKRLKEYEQLYEEQTYKNFDAWQNHIRDSRERILQDLDLQSGHAILRTPQNQGKSGVRGILYNNFEKTWTKRADDFNNEVMKLILRKEQEL